MFSLFFLFLISFFGVCNAEVPVFNGVNEVLTVNFDPSHPCDKGWEKTIGETPEYPGGVWEVLAGYSAEESSISAGCSAELQLGFALTARAPKARQVLLESGWPAEALREARAVSGLGAVVELRLVKDPNDGKDAVASVITTEVGTDFSGASGTWLILDGVKQGFIKDGVQGTIGATGEKGDSVTGNVGPGSLEGFVLEIEGRFGDFGLTMPQAEYATGLWIGFGPEIYISSAMTFAGKFKIGTGFQSFQGQSPVAYGWELGVHFWIHEKVWITLETGRDAYGVEMVNWDYEFQEVFVEAGLGFLLKERLVIEVSGRGSYSHPWGVSGALGLGYRFGGNGQSHK